MADQREAQRQRKITAAYDKLHEGKLGAHWLWCVIEQITNGVSEEEAMRDYGYYARRAAPAPGGEVTVESIRAAGGIVHGDGNIFFTNIAQLRAAIADAEREKP